MLRRGQDGVEKVLTWRGDTHDPFTFPIVYFSKQYNYWFVFIKGNEVISVQKNNERCNISGFAYMGMFVMLLETLMFPCDCKHTIVCQQCSGGVMLLQETFHAKNMSTPSYD